ncbi:MAG: hypothetical protein JGK17_02110 [Microcoleus sp. PH2017_10_PVI_O_A]|nr:MULTISPECIES: hypothetical protein [unclassified Microcoleus]MCC3404408.1 hypothetical protein [Microcoleus sp. PH2017_10_PVI_O_A]MCC3458496.1 hypothetical protein [Microcoleus sp. PH2017_11_PCY_U_A]MCC3477246.1 hypothetical protein [Microcoleus sp. PH2017_12_PCY_D_A]MCC3531773.1 hypothetical protein [Microcoleus sp. PH2017_21_RUC_O_A]MCC3544101.1 hypothetical protein [Microcoleus sp. PH2017_22_RUC_O_B]
MISSVACGFLALVGRPYTKTPSGRSPQIFTKIVDILEQLCYSSLDAGV